MPDFQGQERIYIQPGTAARPVAFAFKAASSATKNDGSIPYGTHVADADITAYDSAGAAVNDLIDANSVTQDTTTAYCTLSYPTTSGAGVYTLEVKLTLSTGAVLVYDAKRVVCGDRSA